MQSTNTLFVKYAVYHLSDLINLKLLPSLEYNFNPNPNPRLHTQPDVRPHTPGRLHI